MADRYPKSFEELAAENAQLRAAIGQLQTSLGSARSGLIARDAEIARLSKPKVPLHKLDRKAMDKFARPMGRRSR